jgi:two-component system sensor histidine kinase KdpD
MWHCNQRLSARVMSAGLATVIDAVRSGSSHALARRIWPIERPGRYAQVVAAVTATTIVLLPVRDHLDVLSALLIYLLLCVALALLVGSGPTVVAAVLASLAFNFFFVPPFQTFRVARGDHILALIAFLVIAVVTSQLLARVRTRTEVAVREQRRTMLLYELNSALISDVTLDAILATIVEQVVRIYGAASCLILQSDEAGSLSVSARFPESAPAEIDRQRAAVAAWAMEHGTAAGRGQAVSRVVTPHGARPGAGLMSRAEADVLYLPIRTVGRTIGVLEVTGRPGGGRFRAEDEQLLTSFANQAALAIERARLTRAAAGAQALAESDAFKSTLLAAVSHDLRTPLAVIRASSTALLDTSVSWTDEARSELLHAIDEEAERLNRMVGNLLDLTRLDGSVLHPDREWYDVAELVADVTHRPGLRLAEHPLTLEIEPNLPLVYFDYVQIAQVLANLLENAVKYTPPGTPIIVMARREVDAVEIAVRDTGPGIAASDIPRLFDAFFRAVADRRTPGAGIGLAICKGFVEAHGGRIEVKSTVGAGTTFRFTLPVDQRGDESDGG